MANVTERVAIGIGPQGDRDTVNTEAVAATNLIVGPATGGAMTGILLRAGGDLNQSFSRLESDGGTVPGSLSRLSGSLNRTVPALSFKIDLKGNGLDPSTDTSGDYDLHEYIRQIFRASRLSTETPSITGTLYEFSASQNYVSFKVWRDTESWVYVGCTCSLSFDLTAGEKGTVTVTVFADSVLFQNAATFPTNTAALAYGTQLDSAPIFQFAGAYLGDSTNDIRGIQSCTIDLSYENIELKDSNVTDGVFNDQGTRTVAFTGDVLWTDDASATHDYEKLVLELGSTGVSPLMELSFYLGQAHDAASALPIEALRFQIPNLRVTDIAKVDETKVVNTITGYASIAGASGAVGDAADEEFSISAE